MNIEKKLYPRIFDSFSQADAKFPEFLEKNFARILLRIEFLWGENELIDYLDSIFLADTPEAKEIRSFQSGHKSRQGFPVEAVEEIVRIKQVHELLHPSISNPYDPYDDSKTVPIYKHAQVDEYIENPDVIEIRSDSTTTPGRNDSPLHEKSFNWPIINTQVVLSNIADLQSIGEKIYPPQGKPVGEILLHYGVIDEHTFRVVLNMQKRAAHENQHLGEILVEVGIIKPIELTRTLLIQSGIPMVDVLTIDIPPEINKIVPLEKIREKQAVPIGNYHDTIYLAVADPFTFEDQSFFTVMTGMKVRLVFAPQGEITKCVNIHYFSQLDFGDGKGKILQLDQE